MESTEEKNQASYATYFFFFFFLNFSVLMNISYFSLIWTQSNVTRNLNMKHFQRRKYSTDFDICRCRCILGSLLG